MPLLHRRTRKAKARGCEEAELGDSAAAGLLDKDGEAMLDKLLAEEK